MKITTRRKLHLRGSHKGKLYYTAKITSGLRVYAEFIPDDGTKETALDMARDYLKGVTQ